VELAAESVLVVSEPVLVSELVLASEVVLASEPVAGVESGAGEESVLAVDPTIGIWSANGTWSAAKAPAAPTATTATAIANAAALRPCGRKRRSGSGTPVRFFLLLRLAPSPVSDFSPAVVSDSTKLSPQCLLLPQPHMEKGRRPMRATLRIACVEPAFNRSNGLFGLAEGLT
jgi:hypothetical protein